NVPAPDEEYLIKITMDGNGMKLTLPENEKGKREFTLQVRPDKMPKEVDLTVIKGGTVGTKLLGLYKVEKDTLTLLLPNDTNKTRPTQFAAPKGSGLIMMTLKKRKDR